MSHTSLHFVNRIDLAINVLGDDETLLDKIEGIVNEAILEDATEDLRVLAGEQYEEYLRPSSKAIIQALLDIEEECVTLVIQDDELMIFEEDEITCVYNAIPVEIVDERTRVA